MRSLAEQQAAWRAQRERIERDLRVLVVEGDAATRRALEEILFRARIPARAVAGGAQALSAVGREHHGVVVTAEVLPGMRGRALVRQIRVSHPTVDVVLTSWEPTVALAREAFRLRALDLVAKPFDRPAETAERLRAALGRSVDRRMRTYVLNDLRRALQELAPEARLRTTAALDERLSAYKHALGDVDRALVVEGSSGAIRPLADRLLQGEMHVESTPDLASALDRVASGGVYLVLVAGSAAEGTPAELVARLRALDPHVVVGMAVEDPDVDEALAALRAGMALYLPWPEADLTPVVLALRDALRRSRLDRLVDNLFVELYREARRALGRPADAVDQEGARAFATFRKLVGLKGVTRPPETEGPAEPGATEAQVDHLLSETIATAEPGEGAERRAAARVPDADFVRFKARQMRASTVAYLGDVGPGGMFIRTPDLLAPGTLVDLDFTLTAGGEGYQVRCRGQVAWVARDDHRSPLGPGFGVKLIDPPDDVAALVAQVVAERAAGSGGGG